MHACLRLCISLLYSYYYSAYVCVHSAHPSVTVCLMIMHASTTSPAFHLSHASIASTFDQIALQWAWPVRDLHYDHVDHLCVR